MSMKKKKKKKVIHRLDRLTSGVLVFARTKEKCQELQNGMREKTISKQYVCRVLGEFPE